jgi:hypothetical protein
MTREEVRMSEIIDRRSFNVAMAYAMLGGAAITITGCGGGSTTGPSGNPTPAPTPTTAATATPVAATDKVGSISANHGHKAVITAAEITAGGGLTLDIMGDATHDHTITLNGDQVKGIGNGGTVSVQSSSTNSHTHVVTFN